MAIFALLYEVMPYSADRHTATNAQEYASLFFLPVLYICFLYIKRKDRYMLFISFTGLCLIGLIHNLVQLYTAIGLVSLGFSALIINPKKYIKSIIFLSIIAVLSVGVSLFPMIFSNLMSVQIHEATASYLTSVVLNPEIPAINTRDLFALCLLSIPVFSVLLDKRRYYILTFEKFILIFSIFSFIVYYYGPWLTKNNVLETRIRDLWALVLPMIYGISLYSFTKIFKHIKTKKLIDVFILSILFIYIFVYNKPEPIIPYKMQWNSKVEQYLRINSTHNPLTYAIASGFTEYALVKGNGYHLRLKEDFLDVYNPFWIPLTENGSTAPDSELPEHIFIYYDKIVYKNKGMLDHERMAPIYEKEEKAAKEAREWIDIYSKNADNITEYYDDEYLTVYYIHQPKSREEKRKELWGIDY
jgi:cytochrome bd-type quinol oxidase subunit 2